ncbi:MAG TPA: valine--tRNA ligase, partial [Candidatus Yonathbacteria bacterium]|nr:valine--tRNA ligase [Candidatus Yonathbacteria bacterium]
MSKSKGNVLNPLDITEQYGTDALRMALVVANAPGADMNLDPQKVLAYKKFANKLWNISRFIITETHDTYSNEYEEKPKLVKEDAELLNEVYSFVKEVTLDMENNRFHIASEKLYHFTWHRLADEILEDSKERLGKDNDEDKLSIQWTLLEILRTTLKMLHPFMPFITEEIWGVLYSQKEQRLLIIEPWPEMK